MAEIYSVTANIDIFDINDNKRTVITPLFEGESKDFRETFPFEKVKPGSRSFKRKFIFRDYFGFLCDVIVRTGLENEDGQPVTFDPRLDWTGKVARQVEPIHSVHNLGESVVANQKTESKRLLFELEGQDSVAPSLNEPEESESFEQANNRQGIQGMLYSAGTYEYYDYNYPKTTDTTEAVSDVQQHDELHLRLQSMLPLIKYSQN